MKQDFQKTNQCAKLNTVGEYNGVVSTKTFSETI